MKQYFDLDTLNDNTYISIFSLYIYTDIPASKNWDYENNKNGINISKSKIGLPQNIKLGLTIGGSFITKPVIIEWLSNFNNPSTQKTEFKSFETYVESHDIDYIDFDVEHGWLPPDAKPGAQGMPVDEFDQFIRNFSEYCKTTTGYFKNNSITFLVGGDTTMGGNFGGVYTLETLYTSYPTEYTKIKNLMNDANTDKLVGVKNIKLLMYCYGASQPDIDAIINGPGSGGQVKLAKIPDENDKKIFYENFNIVFYATPFGVGNNTNIYTNTQVMQHIKDLLSSDNITKYPELTYIINNSLPPFIWTDIDSNLISQPSVWSSTTPNLFDTVNNYCGSSPPPTKDYIIDSINIHKNNLVIDYKTE